MLLFNPKIYLELTVKRFHLQSAVYAFRMVSFCQDIADSYGILFIVRSADHNPFLRQPVYGCDDVFAISDSDIAASFIHCCIFSK